jgi:hypothetical protein
MELLRTVSAGQSRAD